MIRQELKDDVVDVIKTLIITTNPDCDKTVRDAYINSSLEKLCVLSDKIQAELDAMMDDDGIEVKDENYNPRDEQDKIDFDRWCVEHGCKASNGNMLNQFYRERGGERDGI